jgi:hypothetical protein
MAAAQLSRSNNEGLGAAKPRFTSDEFVRLRPARLAGRALAVSERTSRLLRNPFLAPGRLGRRRRMAGAQRKRRIGEGQRAAVPRRPSSSGSDCSG